MTRRTLLGGSARVKGAAAGGLAALLGAATLPPLGWFPCALVAWAPIVLVALQGSWRQAVLAGAVHGLTLAALGTWWMLPALARAGGDSFLVAAGLFAVMVLIEAGRSTALMGLTWLASRTRAGRWVAFPAALVLVDWAWPSALPWTAALMVTAAPVWLQPAEVGGALAVSLWLGTINGAVALAAGGWPDRNRLARPAATALVLVTGVTGWGLARMAQVDQTVAAARPARVALVQGRFAPAHLERRDQVAELRATTLKLLAREPAVDLVLWPENAVVFPTEEHRLPALFRDHLTRDRAQGMAGPRIDVPLVTGVVLARDGRLFNAAVLAEPPGRVLGIYAKRDLIPVGERAVGPLTPPRPFSTGSDASGIRFGDHRLSLSIFFEDLLRARFREAVRAARPDLLVNLTSDSWFGDSPASAIHQGLARVRAVEHRRFLVRATNDGPSSAIDPAGRVTAALESHRPAAGVVAARWLSGDTIYGRAGDAPVVAAAVALLVAAAMTRRRSA